MFAPVAINAMPVKVANPAVVAIVRVEGMRD